MEAPARTAALMVAGLMGFCATSSASDLGKREYLARCAVCHGDDGKGNGPYAGIMSSPIPDLTALSKKNGGVFPFEHVRRIIDGRQVVNSGGRRDCPIWSAVYRATAAEWYFDVPYDPEVYVSTRVQSVTEYLSRVQLE